MSGKKRKMLIKVSIWLLMLVGIPLILMGIILGYKSNENLNQTISQLSNKSAESIKNTSKSLINLSTNLINQTSKQSIDLNSRTLEQASGNLIDLNRKSLSNLNKTLVNFGSGSIKTSNYDVISLSRDAMMNTGNKLIKLSKENLEEETIEKNQEKANKIAEEILISIGSTKEIMRYTAQLSDIKSMKAELCDKVLLSLQKAYPRITNAYIIDKSGNEKAYGSVEELTDGAVLKNIASSIPFETAIKGKIYISEPKISKRLYPYVTIAVPIYQYAGKTMGVFQGMLNISEIGDTVSRTKIGNTGYAFVVNDQGQVLFHPNKQMVVNRTDLKSCPPK